MQRLLLGVLVLLVLSGGAYAWYVRRSAGPLPALSGEQVPADPAFAWGVYTNAYALSDHYDDPFRPEAVPVQVAALKELGVRYVRTNYEWKPEPERSTVNDAWLNGLTDAGLAPVLVLDLPLQTYDEAFRVGRDVAARYPKIKYFQLLNELSGAVKPGYSGLNESDYRDEQYPRAERVIRGLADGIRVANPDAQRILSANWLGVAIIDKFIRAGISFEIVGWNWFSDMGDNPAAKTLDDGSVLDIPAHFTAQGKQFWIMEANRHGGSSGGALDEQRQYLEGFARRSYENPDIGGFFVFKLTNGQDAGSRQAAWGIYETTSVPDGATRTPDGRTIGLGAPKPAGRAYRSVIEQAARGQLQRLAK